MLKLFNTLTRRKEEFVPLEDGKAGLYTCGPTVYNFAHIGNFRTYIFEDILRRYLKYRGYQVLQVMNITDIEDKIIRDAKAEGIPFDTFTEQFTKAFFEDLDALRIERAEHYPRATECIEDMVSLIEQLLEKGHAYRSDGGIYYRIKTFAEYGRLSGIDPDTVRSGARVASDEYEKEDVRDFALWKDRKEDEPYWDTRIGAGRPGWHIECSAMSMRYLGPRFDIHTGGVDNIFPHHENEIAQSEGVTGHPFVNFWLHSEHLVVEGEKMAKSKGNFYTLRDLVNKGYDPLAVRYHLFSVHYRKQHNFTLEGIVQSAQAIERLQEFLRRLNTESFPEGRTDSLVEEASRGISGFEEAMDDDLNTAGALGSLFQMVRKANMAADRGEMRCEDATRFSEVIMRMNSVWGLLDENGTSADRFPAELETLVKERLQARADRDFARADDLRDQIASAGFELEDSREGTRVYTTDSPRVLVATISV